MDTKATTDITIVFSNIDGDSGSTYPGQKDTKSVTGKSVGGVPMVKVSDIADYMGATATYAGTKWTLKRNGQSSVYTQNSTSMTTSISYSYTNPATGTSKAYSHSWTATLPVSAQLIGSVRYVPLYVAAMQLGALTVDMTNLVVYDFRVKGTTPLEDSNTYIVGGDWLEDWSGKSNVYLAEHFKVKEFWNWTYKPNARQLKVAVALLESAERVRYYYNNNSAMSIEVGFRSWEWNKSIEGSWSNSFHMRGRAFDIKSSQNGTALYNAVYNEFCADSDKPIHPTGTGFYRTRDFDNGKSKGYEIETMPRGGVTWLHLQVKPGIDTANDQP